MKLRYEQGHIYDTHSKKKYNPKDKADMEILCKEVNDILLHFELQQQMGIMVLKLYFEMNDQIHVFLYVGTNFHQDI